ncbi:cytochrome c [Desulfococcaceae bacterium HSG8]|nr:cytochrome c [Desulfococcaceae bacterium HSG8]
MKKTLISFAFLILGGLLFYCSPSCSADGETLFNTKCGKCHNSRGQGPVFAPVRYASSQWERFFQRNKHKRKKDISKEVTPEEAELIKKYLVDHAADSDRPIAAGLR